MFLSSTYKVAREFESSELLCLIQMSGTNIFHV
jgi:hypothetical protein